MTARAAEILSVKTCPNKADQPGNGKIYAEMLKRTLIESIYDDNNEQDPRHIAEDKKPE
jgi:hypothetical protein